MSPTVSSSRTCRVRARGAPAAPARPRGRRGRAAVQRTIQPRAAVVRADGPTAYFGLHNVVMRHDIPKVAPVSEAYPHLVLHNLTTKVGRRIGTILQHLFPVPKPDTKRIISFVNRDDFISFRHHMHST